MREVGGMDPTRVKGIFIVTGMEFVVVGPGSWTSDTRCGESEGSIGGQESQHQENGCVECVTA